MKLKETPEDFRVYEINDMELSEKKKLYSYWRMRKKNYTTQDAAQRISDAVRIPLKWVGWAGNKDRKAITEQWVSIKGIPREKTERLKLKDIELEFIGYRSEPLSLGNHKGNHFEIIVRDVTKKPKPINKFLNFYGEQRFSANNSEVGKAIVKKDFGNAVKLVLENNGRQEEKVRNFIRENPNNFVGALKQIPKKTLRMFVHSYQSKLWNECAQEYEKKGEKEDIPLIGFEIIGKDKVIESVMEREGISERDFIIKEIPDISSEGGMRRMYAQIMDLSIGELEEDRILIEFTLGKGIYATECVKALFENS